MLNRIKSQSVTGLHTKYKDVAAALADTSNGKRLPTTMDTYVSKNINLNNHLNNHHLGGGKSETYESVCPPEDVTERSKQLRKNSVIRNYFDQSAGNNHPNKCNKSCNHQHNCCNLNANVVDGSNQHSNTALQKTSSNLNRNLKRVSSAPAPQNLLQKNNNEIGNF